MTLDMLEIFIDSVIKSMNRVDDVEHFAYMLFILCVLGLGCAIALSIVLKEYSKNFLTNSCKIILRMI